jgi:hypothetical protein
MNKEERKLAKEFDKKLAEQISQFKVYEDTKPTKNKNTGKLLFILILLIIAIIIIIKKPF